MADDFGYEDLAVETQEMLVEAGAPCILRSPAAADYTAAGTVTGSPVNYVGTAVIVSIERPFREGESVIAGDQKALVSPLDFDVEPRAGWLFNTGSSYSDTGRFRVIDVRTTKPGPTTVLYELHLRRA